MRNEIRAVIHDVFDKGAGSWSAVRDAGLLGLALSESLGGEGLGWGEVAVLVDEVGRRASDLPVAEVLATTMPVLAGADIAASSGYIEAVLAGEAIILPATNEPGRALPTSPRTKLVDGKVTGHKINVLAAPTEGELAYPATLLLVSTATGLALVDPQGPGVEQLTNYSSARTPTDASALTQVGYRFDSAPALLELPSDALRQLNHYAAAAQLVRGNALLAGALELTAEYIKERSQFGRQLAEFQAVAMQIADVYIVAKMTSVVADQLLWRLDHDIDVSYDLAVGAAWFTHRVPAAVQTCHHLHGGMGVDETYPLHRYFSRIKQISQHLGGRVGTLTQVRYQEDAADNLELTAEQRAFKAEVREYFATLVSPEDKREMMTDRHGPAYHRNIKKMGADGWMGVGWPTEYGGKGLGEIEQQIFANEAARADVHLPSVTLQTVGPTLQTFGTQKQKDMFLADILTGDVHFAIGYSEADAGTDLASLRCSARREGDEYIVNGQKMWTTGGHAADYIWLAVRTDPDAPKHKGISILIVDTKDPGYSWTPIVTCDGSHHVNATYYNDVRVPADMLVGEENDGWRLITTQLNHERIMLGPAGRLEGLRDMVVEWASSRTDADGTPILELPTVREVLAQVTVAFRVNELLNWRVAGGTSDPQTAVAEASASKVFASDEVQGLGLALEEIVTTYGDPEDADTAWLLEYLDATSKRNLVLTFGGGVNEVQRELIAMFGLGLPRVPR